MAWAHHRTGRRDRSRATPISASVIEQYARMGMTVQQAPTTEDALEIMPNAWDSLMTFLACQTQWRVVAGMAGLIWLGLDYPACRIVLDNIKAPAHAFADLRIMETAALAVLNEVAD